MFKQLAIVVAAVAALGSMTGCVVANPNTVSAYDAQRMSTVIDATDGAMAPLSAVPDESVMNPRHVHVLPTKVSHSNQPDESR